MSPEKAKLILQDPEFTLLDKLSPTAKIFVASQLTHCAKPKWSVMWSKEEKALALAMYKSGPRSYRLLRKIFKLPSQRTLQRELGNIEIVPGLNESIFSYLAIKSKQMQQMQKCCVLLFDEVYLTPHIALNMKTKSIQVVWRIWALVLTKILLIMHLFLCCVALISGGNNQ